MQDGSVAWSIMKTIKADELAHCHEEVNRENRLAIRLLALWGLPLAIANVIVQMGLANDEELLLFFLRTSWMCVYLFAVLVVERWVIPADFPHATALLYVVEAPIMICSILLGSIWDPGNQAITFLLFLIAMPVFILDRPVRVMLIALGWVVLFLGACYLVKSPEIFERDLLHAFEFYLGAFTVANVVIRVRVVALERTEQVRHSLEHDELTDLRNRRSLERHAPEYLGKPLTVSISELDQLSMFNDIYGHEVGNQVLVRASEILVDAFGRESVYRYGGDEALCVVEGVSEEDCLAAISECRLKLRESRFDGQTLSPTSSVGYVLGEPQTEFDFKRMIQLAEIYAHKAGSKGRGQAVGGVFSEESFHAGIAESSMDTHLQGYETNQLTGLPSMSYFVARTNDVLATIVDPNRDAAIGFITLPQIKSYNNEFGYECGDALICRAADLLREAFPGRLLCNIAGSQFGVMCYTDEIEAGMQVLSAGLLGFREGYLAICRAGFAVRAEEESSISLLDKARVAERSIHDDANVLYRLYDEQLDTDVKFREYIVSHVDEAIECGYLEVYYQPIIRTSTREICNEEALSRWNDPEHGMIAPFRFIPPLEESRQIYKLSLHVVKQVLADLAYKRELGMTIVPVSVNLSRYDFEQCDIVQEISELVDASGFSREMVRIEITESAFMKNQGLLKREVNRFRQGGFQVWMDDFGSEYSTLNLLQDLDFDLIKIDMEFMRNGSDSGKNLVIVSNIINMANQMGVATLVEGVESEEHMGILRAMGCDKMQGFLFSEPRPLQSVIDRVMAGSARSFEQHDAWS